MISICSLYRITIISKITTIISQFTSLVIQSLNIDNLLPNTTCYDTFRLVTHY